VYSVVGTTSGFFGNNTGANTAQVTALLVPPHDRQRTSADLGDEMRTLFVSSIPGAKIQIGLPNAFGFGGFGGQPIQVQVQGVDPATVDRLAGEVEQAVRAVPGAASVQNSNDNRQTQLRAKIDWARAADLGVTPQAAGTASGFLGCIQMTIGAAFVQLGGLVLVDATTVLPMALLLGAVVVGFALALFGLVRPRLFAA